MLVSDHRPGAPAPGARPAPARRRRAWRGLAAAAVMAALASVLPFATQASAGSPVPAADTTYRAAALATRGYWMLRTDGVVYAFGEAPNLGNGPTRAAEAVKIEPHPGGQGYYILYADGFVDVKGAAARRTGNPTSVTADRQDAVGLLRAGETATSISVHPSGRGYWIFTNRGRVYAFGNAAFLNDIPGVLSVPLNGPVLDSVATPSGNGYYMVGSDGGVFTFGDARFAGSVPEVLPGVTLNAPVQSLVPDPDGDGYWLVAADGGVFSFNAPFVGALPEVIRPSVLPNKPITGMVSSAGGYIMVGEDGGAFVFPVGGSTPFFGSLGGNPPPLPITSLAAYTIDTASPPPPPPTPGAPPTPATATATVTRGTTDTINVSWTAVPGATSYVVSGLPGGTREVTGTTVSAPMPLPSAQVQATYSFTINVQARNAGGTSAAREADGPSRCDFSPPTGPTITPNTPLSFTALDTDLCVGTLANDPRNPGGSGPSVVPGLYRVRQTALNGAAGDRRCWVQTFPVSGTVRLNNSHGPVVIDVGTDIARVRMSACRSALENNLAPPTGFAVPAAAGATFPAGIYFSRAGLVPANYASAAAAGARASIVELPVGTYNSTPVERRCYWARKQSFTGNELADDLDPKNPTVQNPQIETFTMTGVAPEVGVDVDYRLNTTEENGGATPLPEAEIGVCTFRRAS